MGFLAFHTAARAAAYHPATPAATASLSEVMMGLGAVCTFTPARSGLVKVAASFSITTLVAAVTMKAAGRYGTGTAPVNGAAVTGTLWGGNSDQTFATVSAAGVLPCSFIDVLTLTPGTAYWFDFALATGNVLNSARIQNLSMTMEEL